MKLSEFIKELQNALNKYGDLDFHFCYAPGESYSNYYSNSIRIAEDYVEGEIEIVIDD